MNQSASQIYSELLKRQPLLEDCAKELRSAFEVLTVCFRNGGTLLVCGNGGSAADAGHIVGELMNKFAFHRPIPEHDRQRLSSLGFTDWEKLANHLECCLPSICLSAQSPLITAISNDVDAGMIFAQQVYGYGKPGDVLLALSTSGNSLNVVNAVKVAKLRNMTSIALTGSGGGTLAEHCEVTIRVPEATTWKVQELHQPVYHALCAMVEAEFFGG